jgi:hypothetical protein
LVQQPREKLQVPLLLLLLLLRLLACLALAQMCYRVSMC